MPTYRLLAPISVRLSTNQMTSNFVELRRYSKEELDSLLGDSNCYWAPIHLKEFTDDFWLVMETEKETVGEAYEWAILHAIRFLEALSLFKTMFCYLQPAGVLVKAIQGFGENFGWENTLREPYYFLEESEYNCFSDFLTQYDNFWETQKEAAKTNKDLKRISWAKYYLRKSYETENLNERMIFLTIALEAILGGGTELRYRYSNRTAVLLGDDEEKRKKYFQIIWKAYDTRSKIVHGDINWQVSRQEILEYTETIRQMVLRSISLYSNGIPDPSKLLDESLHDTNKQQELLMKARALFGPLSDYKQIE